MYKTREEALADSLKVWGREFEKTKKKLKERKDILTKVPKDDKNIPNRLKRIKRLEKKLIYIETKCIDIKDELAKLKQQKTLIIMEIDSLSYEIEQLLNFGVYKQAKIYNIINQIEKLERKLIELDK